MYTAKDGMSCYERNVYAWKETATLPWDISMDIICLTFPSFSPTKRFAKFGWQKRIVCGKKEEKAVSPTQLKSDRL